MPTVTANRPLWFIDNLARVLADGETTAGALDLVEVAARGGDMPPLHVHHDADETFYVLEGEVSLHLPGRSVTLGAGESFFAPRACRTSTASSRSGRACSPSARRRASPTSSAT